MTRAEQGALLGERYLVGERIASGGMADVWSAQDSVLKRQVALKVMRPDTGHEKLFAARFRDGDEVCNGMASFIPVAAIMLARRTHAPGLV